MTSSNYKMICTLSGTSLSVTSNVFPFTFYNCDSLVNSYSTQANVLLNYDYYPIALAHTRTTIN